MKISKCEEEIIKTFIVKSRQERILWELGNIKKRDQVFWRFVDVNIFKDNCLHEAKYLTNNEIKLTLYNKAQNKKVYYIGEEVIGEMPLEEAITRINIGCICIVYCGNGIGYYQGEEEYGNRPRYLLLAEGTKLA